MAAAGKSATKAASDRSPEVHPIDMDTATVCTSLSFWSSEELATSACLVSKEWHSLARSAALDVLSSASPGLRERIEAAKTLPRAPLWQKQLWERERQIRRLRLIEATSRLKEADRQDQQKQLCMACQSSDVAKAKSLLETGNVDPDALYPLHYPEDGRSWEDSPLGHATGGQEESAGLEIAKLLIRYGATTDTVAGYGSTPLHLASQLGRCDIVVFLVRIGGADVNFPSRSHGPMPGRTAIEWTTGGINDDWDGGDQARTATAEFLSQWGEI